MEGSRPGFHRGWAVRRSYCSLTQSHRESWNPDRSASIALVWAEMDFFFLAPLSHIGVGQPLKGVTLVQAALCSLANPEEAASSKCESGCGADQGINKAEGDQWSPCFLKGETGLKGFWKRVWTESKGPKALMSSLYDLPLHQMAKDVLRGRNV